MSLVLDEGLAGFHMPGADNMPQAMVWDATSGGFIASGIPIPPYDDAANKNTYPMMRVEVHDASQAVLASTEIVLPVSDELACTTCHASGGPSGAMPSGGWVFDPDPIRDERINILRLHDELNGGDAD